MLLFFITSPQRNKILALTSSSNYFTVDTFCSEVDLIVASYLWEVVIYGCAGCHRDALMLICCSCSHSAAHTHTHADLHICTHHAEREVVGLDSCWQFAACGLSWSRCLPVWGSAVFCWTRALIFSLSDWKRHCGRQRTVDGYCSTSFPGT